MRTFLTPTTQIILAKWNVKACLEAISKYRVSHLSLIPSVVHQIVNYPNVEQYDFSAVVFAGCGAAHLPAELSARMQKLLPTGLTVTEGYGMSEVTMTAMSEPVPGMFSGKIQPAPGSAGILWPGVEARIVREDGTDADVNEPGELHVRGANRSLGYWDNEKASKETFASDGWVRSGDLFRADEMGRFFFIERIKDTLKISGIQVSPVEIETVLLAEPSKLIADVSVAGVQGHGRTSDETVPRAWVVLNDKGKEVERTKPGQVAKKLEDWSRANLSKFKWLRGGIEVIDEIPKSPTGKVLRRLLRDRYEKQQKNKTEAKL
jgi:acyl-CoA synthetase (AMP-forming)/AMP-acid ligase II